MNSIITKSNNTVQVTREAEDIGTLSESLLTVPVLLHAVALRNNSFKNNGARATEETICGEIYFTGTRRNNSKNMLNEFNVKQVKYI